MLYNTYYGHSIVYVIFKSNSIPMPYSIMSILTTPTNAKLYENTNK